MSTEVFGCGFDCVPSFHSGEVVSKRAGVRSRSSECEPEGNLDGFLARLHACQQNEGKEVLRTAAFAKEVAATLTDSQKVGSFRIANKRDAIGRESWWGRKSVTQE